MYCYQCGAETISDAKFCQNCGSKLINETRSNNDQIGSPSAIVISENDIQQSEVNSVNVQDVLPDQSKTFLGGIHHPWRRFFARTVDLLSSGLIIFVLFSFLVGMLFPQNVDGFLNAVENPITAGIIIYLLWLPIEAVILAFTGTTPAKWVFGIRVLSHTGNKLSYPNALKRVFLVWIQGEGLGIPLVTLFTRLFAYRRLTKTGTTLWDTSVESIVTHKKWGVIRAIATILAVLVTMIIMSILISIGNSYG